MVVVVWERQYHVGDMQVVVVGHWAAGRGWEGGSLQLYFVVYV